MQNGLPSSVSAFLAARGGARDPAEIVRVFRSAAPAGDADPLSQENLAYLGLLADCVGAMDERLYEHYRALADLFRAGVFRAPRAELLSRPAWNEVREKGVSLGLLPEDLYGFPLPVPHIGRPERSGKEKEGIRG